MPPRIVVVVALLPACFEDAEPSSSSSTSSESSSSTSSAEASAESSSSAGEPDVADSCRAAFDAMAISGCANHCDCPADCFDGAGELLYATPEHVLGDQAVPELCRCWPQAASQAACESLDTNVQLAAFDAEQCIEDMLRGACRNSALQMCTFVEPDPPCSSSCGELIASCWELYGLYLEDDSISTCVHSFCWTE